MAGDEAALEREHRAIVDEVRPIIAFEEVDSNAKIEIMGRIRAHLEHVGSTLGGGGGEDADLIKELASDADTQTYRVEALALDAANPVHRRAVDALANALTALGDAIKAKL